MHRYAKDGNRAIIPDIRPFFGLLSNMSDDEYVYQDAEYEDFQEMLYDADPTPDLADDLAERAAYSPVWQDNPVEELRDYFSDWEYYSDDYFDDDPNLLNKSAEKIRGRRQESQKLQHSATRGRKRKLSEARERPQLTRAEMDALSACLLGTVWKTQSPEPAAVYQKGIDLPVSLRLSEEIMRSAYSKKRGFGKGRLKRDESWANDLSLEDMGLRAERGLSIHEQPSLDNEGEEIEHEQENGVDEGEDDSAMVVEEAVEVEAMAEEPYRAETQPETAPLETLDVQAEVDHRRGFRKKRKLDHWATGEDGSVGSAQENANTEHSEQPKHENSIATQGKAKRGRSRPENAGGTAQQSTDQILSNGSKKPHRTGRKRKLSFAESSATASAAGGRAKRIDSKPEGDSRPVVTTAASTRPTRSRKN